MKTKRAIVTGGAGFIGSHLVDALLATDAEVLVIDDLSSGEEGNLENARSTAGDRVNLLTASICSDQAVEAVKQFKPDTLFHFGAQINVRRSVEDPAEDAESNVLGTVKMLEALHQAKGARFVFASTGGAIYGTQKTFPADEDHPIHPKAPYGVSKRAGELYLDLYGRDYGLRTVALRLGNVYGPRQNPKGEAGVVSIFSERILEGKSICVNGSGEQTRDFVFVDDVVRAFMLFAVDEQESGFSAYNVGWGKEVSVNDIVEGLQAAARELELFGPEGFVVEGGPALAGEQQRSVVDPGRLGKELGWNAEVPLGEGLIRTVRSFRDQGGAAK